MGGLSQLLNYYIISIFINYVFSLFSHRLNNISTTNSESVQDSSIVKVDPQGVSFRKQSSLVDGETKRQLSQGK